MKQPRCWARKLDDCSEKMSREHIISNSTWPGATREIRDRHSLTLRAGVYRNGDLDTNVPGGYTRTHPVGRLVRRVLCTRHNEALSGCDEEAGRFARALDDFWAICMKRPYGTLQYTPKRFVVDAVTLQRWFVKTSITWAVDDGDPLGGLEAEASTPTDELVDIAFGLRAPVGHFGLWTLDAPPQEREQLNSFSFQAWRRRFDDPTPCSYIAGAFVHFRGLWFAVNYESDQRPPHPQLPRRYPDREPRFVRFGEVSMPERDVRLRFSLER